MNLLTLFTTVLLGFGGLAVYDQSPVILGQYAPVYPAAAIEARVQGTVLVRTLVGKDGTVRKVRIARSIPMVNDAALEAVRHWEFAPARRKGEPVAVWIMLPVKFTLH